MKMSVPLQHLFPYPIDALLAVLPPADDAVWNYFNGRQKGQKVHGATRTIVFAWSEGWDGRGTPMVLWPDYAPAPLRAAAATCGERIRQHYGGGMITRLIMAEMPPRAQIAPHRDMGLGLEVTHRCHVPLVTNDAVTFFIEDEAHTLRAGETYELDNMRRHAVSNDSDDRRVHLICNILPADYQRAA